jgi:hypothetical protein
MDDLRGTPTFACICGCLMFELTVQWDQETREIGWYDLAQKCKADSLLGECSMRC